MDTTSSTSKGILEITLVIIIVIIREITQETFVIILVTFVIIREIFVITPEISPVTFTVIFPVTFPVTTLHLWTVCQATRALHLLATTGSPITFPGSSSSPGT